MTANGAEQKPMSKSVASGFAPQPTFTGGARIGPVGWLTPVGELGRRVSSLRLLTDIVRQRCGVSCGARVLHAEVGSHAESWGPALELLMIPGGPPAFRMGSNF